MYFCANVVKQYTFCNTHGNKIGKGALPNIMLLFLIAHYYSFLFLILARINLFNPFLSLFVNPME